LIDSGEGVSGFVTDFIFFITISLNLRCVNILQLAHRNMIYDFNLDQRINLKLYLNVKVYKIKKNGGSILGTRVGIHKTS